MLKKLNPISLIKGILYLLSRKGADFKQEGILLSKYKSYFMMMLKRILLRRYYIFPVVKNKVLLMSFESGKYSCNPKRISEYLQKKYGEELEIIWAFTEPDKFTELNDKGYKLVKYNTAKYFKAALTCKVFVYNMRIPGEIPFRKEQISISTGHGGGAYKKLLLDTPEITNIERKSIKVCTRNTSLFVSSCKKYTDCVIRGAYGYTGEVLETGMPRNDDLVNRNFEAGKYIREYYGIPSKNKIIIYAPTYRKGTRTANDYGLDAVGIMQAAKERFGGEWTVMYRMHYFIKTELTSFPKECHIVDATEYEDMQDLIMAADILITDYSSCVWDFALMDKPCFLYATDIDSYVGNQGFYTNVYDWHFPIGKNNRELMNQIINFDEKTYLEGIHLHLKEMGNLESGQATALIGERIYEECMK